MWRTFNNKFQNTLKELFDIMELKALEFGITSQPKLFHFVEKQFSEYKENCNWNKIFKLNIT